MKLFKPNARPTLRSVIGRGHLIVALLAISMASLSLTFLGVLALRVRSAEFWLYPQDRARWQQSRLGGRQ